MHPAARNTTLTLAIRATRSSFQIFFYALRPGFIRYQAPTRWIGLNWLVQLSFNALVVKYWGWHSMLYFLLSSHLAGSLHPLAGHFIAEHYCKAFTVLIASLRCQPSASVPMALLLILLIIQSPAGSV